MIRKAILVVGGSSDIGKAIIKRFAENGFDIYATQRNGSLHDVEEVCKEKGVDLKTFNLDVKDLNAMSGLFQKLKEDGVYLDCVVYCAGLSLDEKLLMDESCENIAEIIDVNLKGAVYCGRESMKYFCNLKHGSIIFISSLYGIYGGSCESVYSATKGGLIALTKSLSQECGGFNVRVNCIAPGYINTKMTERYNNEDKLAIKSVTPLKRLGEPDDIAGVVKFLSGDDSAFITGETIVVSGGAVRY